MNSPIFFKQPLDEARYFLAQNPDIERLEVFLCDLNGIVRGKWLPISDLEKVFRGELKLPVTLTTPDIWGRDIPELCEPTGDTDGICLPIPNSLKRIPWLKQPTAQLMLQMTQGQERTTSPFDARNLLINVYEHYQKRQLKPVTAPELEFYLSPLHNDKLDSGSERASENMKPSQHQQICQIDALVEHEELLDDIRKACDIMQVPIGAISKELSPGQWEINLQHSPCPLQAADHAVTLKRIIKAIAKKHDLVASFMAKPDPRKEGSGYHTHISVLDNRNRNIFNNHTDEGNQILRYAIGGLCQAMAESFLLFAPHQNSYRRFAGGNHTSPTPSWGYENRYASIRIPSGSFLAKRIEHRVAGADANPYLVQAAILAGVLHGIDHNIEPDLPCLNKAGIEPNNSHTTNANKINNNKLFSSLPIHWHQAIGQFQHSTFIAEQFGTEFQQAFSIIKHTEFNEFNQYISPLEQDTYRHTI